MMLTPLPPPGRGPYGEKTVPVRVPISLLPEVTALLDAAKKRQRPDTQAAALRCADSDSAHQRPA
jgi:hypothetical protein